MSAARTGTGATLRSVLPRGGVLPDDTWRQRHRAICVLLWLHVLVLPVLGAVAGQPLGHCLLEVVGVASCAATAQATVLGRTLRASFATLGLLASSALLVHMFHGLIEVHFHFFVTVAVISLYQAWTPYLLGVGFVLLHHAVVGTLAADRVYNHPGGQAHPAAFALLHTLFLLAESIACLTYWRLTEDTLDAERRQRAETEASNDALFRANRQVSDLVAMLSHDLRTPLTVVNGYASLLLQSWPELDDTRRRRLVERVGSAGHSLQELLEDTLAASAFDAGALEPRPQPVELGAVVREALETVSGAAGQVEVAGVDVVPDVLVDRTHLKQVVANVVSNAVKYGAPPYRISAVSRPGAVLVRIADHGPGVPEEFVPHLFERYSRAEEARTGPQRGTGLGLFIARALLQASGGDVGYERGPDGGSVFVLRLPPARRDVAHADAAPTLARGAEVARSVSV